MDFVDRVIVRLATPAAREALFDQGSLAQIVATAYDADALAAEGPYAAVFNNVEVGMSIPSRQVIDGRWARTDTGCQTDARFEILATPMPGGPRLDAIWQGAVVVRITPPSSVIQSVRSARPALTGIDAEIAAAGPFPDTPAATEAARRERLAARLRAVMTDPDALTPAAFDRWLAGLGVANAAELVARAESGTLMASGLQVTFSEPTTGVVASSRGLPVTVALLVRDAGFSVASLLAESRLVRDQLASLGVSPRPDASLPSRKSVVVAWVVPATVFDDDDWPGADPAARRIAAGAWLNPQGIALLTAA